MYYKSYKDLAKAISYGIHKIPKKIDVVVGVPRSGLMAAGIVALNLNIALCDLNSFEKNEKIRSGGTRQRKRANVVYPHDAQAILVVDDSIASGKSLEDTKKIINNSGYTGEIYYLCVYSNPESVEMVDIYFEVVCQPRIFEWNLFHRPFLMNCAVDIDGVLCHDPSEHENDDGPNYKKFILNAKILNKPTATIGNLVTSRLEIYREETEEWLKKNEINYINLHMLKGASAEERRRYGLHVVHKVEIYKSLKDANLFIESDTSQAEVIAKKSGKPVINYEKSEIIYPGITLRHAKVRSERLLAKFNNLFEKKRV